MWQILQGLKDMHEKRIIHRDIKTTNILINSEWNVKICDFGLAKCLYGQQTEIEYTKNYLMKEWPELESLVNQHFENFEGTALD